MDAIFTYISRKKSHSVRNRHFGKEKRSKQNLQIQNNLEIDSKNNYICFHKNML